MNTRRNSPGTNRPRNPADLTRSRATEQGVSLVQVLLIVAGVAIVSTILYSLYGKAADDSRAAINGLNASGGSSARSITSTKNIAQAGALYAADYGVTAPLSIHPVISDGYLSMEEIVHPDDDHPLGQGGACRAFFHKISMRNLNTSRTPPVDYRFSYWGRADLGQDDNYFARHAEFLSKGTDLGWLVYILDFDPDSTSFPHQTKEDIPFIRFLIDGGVVTRQYRSYTLDGEQRPSSSFKVMDTFFADFSDTDVVEHVLGR